MKYVKVEWSDRWRGYRIDPRDYIANIPELKESLPLGAGAYLSEPGHYDLSSSRCIKNVELAPGSLGASADGRMRFDFLPNEWSHDFKMLTVEYVDVVEVKLEDVNKNEDDFDRVVLMDEILPCSKGCSHEIVMLGGRLTIFCADLNAAWIN